MAAQEYRAPESISRLQQRALLVGGIALVLSIVGAVKFPGPFYQSYLMSFMLVLGLTLGGFQFRALIYFAIWLALMFVFDRLSKQQDVNQSDRALRRRLKMLAGPGIILYAFAMTFVAIDWVMSLSPHWASTIYG